MKNNKNSVAFPFNGSEQNSGRGLTKREYFTAMAMQGQISNGDWMKAIKDSDSKKGLKLLCGVAIEIADELLKQLSVEKDDVI